MTSEILLQRAQLLMSQNRPEQAAEQLRHLLSQEPDDADAHAMLALCLTHDQDRWHDATREAEQAIHIAPDSSFSHYALAAILDKRNRLPEALAAVQEAIRLETYEPHYHGLAASIYAQQSRWQDALDAASKGMEIDPEDDHCAAMRALALERLGRSQDALAEAEAAVARNPDSADSHAMRGWAQLHSGDYRAAQDSFREALRLDPTDEFARSGMIQALNNDHLIFRMVFRFYSFVGRLASGAQWAIIIGLFLGMRVLRGLAREYPALQPYVIPISILYLLFCVLSWIADPLFNTFLRFHKFGKYLLSHKQKWASNSVAACIGIGVLGAVLFVALGDYGGAMLMFMFPVFLTFPVASAFEVDEGWPLIVSIVIAVVLSLLCFATIGLLAVSGPWQGFSTLYILGSLAFCFGGSYLQTVTVRR